MCRWLKWDGTGRDRRFIDPEEHRIFFLRQYISGGGYEKSETNQLILNLKKSPNAPDRQLYYKNKAIDKFASELQRLIGKTKQRVAVTWIPTSKAKNDPEYDNRLSKVVRRACVGVPNLVPTEFFISKSTVAPLHDGGERNPINISRNWGICDVDLEDCKGVYIIDDVLTTGSSMRAAIDLTIENFGDIRIVGIVWAFAIDDPNPLENFVD